MANALVNLAHKMKYHQESFSSSSLQKLHNFALIAKFCKNIVQTSFCTNTADVLQLKSAKDGRDEDALADIFCYEAMRTFGDRIMRPKNRIEFQNKLAEIAQREFLCSKKTYNGEYVEKLILGDYEEKDPDAFLSLTKLSTDE